MASLFNNLFDKNNPAKKLQAEIDNTEFRKQALFAPLNNDIAAARQKIESLFYKIGTAVYESSLSGAEADKNVMQGYFNQITDQKSLIAEREAKIAEFSKRYEEELEMLKASLATMIGEGATASDADGDSSASGKVNVCKNCGAAYTPGDDVFCTGCGTKLK